MPHLHLTHGLDRNALPSILTKCDSENDLLRQRPLFVNGRVVFPIDSCCKEVRKADEIRDALSFCPILPIERNNDRITEEQIVVDASALLNERSYTTPMRSEHARS
jgi:hypothetical protein